MSDNNTILKAYSYYKGEADCPYKDSGRRFWWKLESYAFNAKDHKEKNALSKTMIFYLQEHMWEGDGQHDTTKKEMLKRANELYNKGFWSCNYISFKRHTFQQVVESENKFK